MSKLNCVTLICLTTFSLLAYQTSNAVGPSTKASDSHKSKVITETPEQVLKIKKTVFNDMSQSVIKGEKRFSQTCIYCHGYEGSGGRSKKLQGRTIAPDRLFKTITKGRRRGSSVMPSWSKTFSITERWELVAYIMSLSEKK
jgi:mono/diheme cytochrome c family protein